MTYKRLKILIWTSARPNRSNQVFRISINFRASEMYPWYQRTPMGHPEQDSGHQKPEKVRWNDLFTLENPDLDFRKAKLLRACSQNFDGI